MQHAPLVVAACFVNNETHKQNSDEQREDGLSVCFAKAETPAFQSLNTYGFIPHGLSTWAE